MILRVFSNINDSVILSCHKSHKVQALHVRRQCDAWVVEILEAYLQVLGKNRKITISQSLCVDGI